METLLEQLVLDSVLVATCLGVAYTAWRFAFGDDDTSPSDGEETGKR